MKLGMTGTVRLFAALLAVGWLTGLAMPVWAQQTEPSLSTPDRITPAQPDSIQPGPIVHELVQLDPDDLLVLEIRIGKKSSGHGVVAYQHGDDILLPLGGLTSIVELAIMVDPVNGRAAGWIIDEDRTFVLDIGNLTLEREGVVESLSPATVARDEYDLYVRSQDLQLWLPVDLDINLARMNMTLKPREVLPFQARLEREKQRERWLLAHGREDLAYPLQVTPYRMWSWPMTDATLALNNTVAGKQVRFSSQSWADFGGMSSNLFLTHVGTETHTRTTARLKTGRWDPDGALLGPLQATHFQLGDLNISRIPLISANKQGIGFSFSNQDLYRSREFDMTEVRGDATPGWEAELYINGTLYDFQTIGEDGQYVFEDVPMVVGNNTFRTVLYGPRGEKHTVVDHANISNDMMDVGELKYTATLIREGAGLLTSSPGQAAREHVPWSQQLELAYAFSNRSALVADISHLDFNGRRELFTSLTSHNSLGPVHVEGIMGASTRGGRAMSLGARSSYRGHNILLQSSLNDAYRAESPDGFEYMHRQTVARAGGTLARTASKSLTYGLSVLSRDYHDSDLIDDREYRFRLSGNMGRVLLSHSISANHRNYTDTGSRSLKGTQLLRTWVGSMSLRADINYDIEPARLRSASATATVYRSNHLQATLKINQYMRDTFGDNSVNLSVTRLFEYFTLGLNLHRYQDTGTTFGITLGTFLARDNRSNSWSSTHRRMANRSAASVRAFIDLDNDGAYDNDDIPLEGVGFLNLTAWRGIRTNDNGIALLPGIMVHQAQVIELDLTTISDPYLVPINEGVKVLGHPGGIVDVELPFAFAGEIEGMVIDEAYPDQVVRHVGLELLDPEGKRVKATVSEFDGYYYFADVLPGHYTLAVIPSTLNTGLYEIPDSCEIEMAGQGGFMTGPDILLKRHAVVPATGPVALIDGAETEPEYGTLDDLESGTEEPLSETAPDTAIEAAPTEPVQEPAPPIPPEQQTGSRGCRLK
jgi:hypothetical protein